MNHRTFRKVLDILRHPRLWPICAKRVFPGFDHLEMLRHIKVESLIDVGANVGQFSSIFNYVFPNAQILAFEPIEKCANRYSKVLAKANAYIYPYALASKEGSRSFYLANRADSSSLLKPGDGQSKAFDVEVKMEVTIPVRTLDSVVAAVGLMGPTLLKIDVQGAELQVLKGAIDVLRHVEYCYVELSFVDLYEGQSSATDVAEFLFVNGFTIRGVFNQISTKAFGPTQADFLFIRTSS